MIVVNRSHKAQKEFFNFFTTLVKKKCKYSKSRNLLCRGFSMTAARDGTASTLIRIRLSSGTAIVVRSSSP